MSSKPSSPLPHWFLIAIWVGALVYLGIGLGYSEQVQGWLKRRVHVQVIRPTPLATPTLVWPTPFPTNTPRLIPTIMPTNTPLPPANLSLQNDEIDTMAAAIAYEALSESRRGQEAVGYVILHRCELTHQLPSEVLTKEFFGTEVGADYIAKMKEWWKPDNNDIPLDDWQQITYLAINVANRWGYDEFPTSTHFYSICVLGEPPTWVNDLELLRCIGCHCFYGPKGG